MHTRRTANTVGPDYVQSLITPDDPDIPEPLTNRNEMIPTTRQQTTVQIDQKDNER